jgi:hypothetical protein
MHLKPQVVDIINNTVSTIMNEGYARDLGQSCSDKKYLTKHHVCSEQIKP